MRRIALVPLALAAVLAACGDAQPCTSCPPLDGTYTVQWTPDAGSVTRDGGCSVSVPKLDAWTLAQRGTNVTTTIAGAQLGGTLYDTYDLVLGGSSEAASYRLKALAIPTGASADAGIKLQGTFTARVLELSGDLCEATEAFTAQRISR
jgi:hypothetical protein